MLAAMLLTLVRHGDAGSPRNSLGDAGRWLSTHGRSQALATGRALAEREVRPTHVWTSPLVRAVQTAELILAALDYAGEAETRDDLYPDSSPAQMLAALRTLPASADVLAVGHMPYMASAAGAALDLGVGGLSTAEAFRIELDGSGEAGELLWRFRGRFI